MSVAGCLPSLICAALACAPAAAAYAQAGPAATSARAAHAAGAQTAPRVILKAALSPKRLGAATTVSTALTIAPAPGHAAAAVSEVQLLYPAGMGFGASELGLEQCSPARLAASGPGACPHNSIVGSGSAVVEVPLGPRPVQERAPIEIFSQPLTHGLLGLLFAAIGRSPVIADLSFGGFIVRAGPPFGGRLDTTLPLIPSVPKGPDVALVALSTTIGPKSLVYHERVRGKAVAFHPKGMLLPMRCPRGGFAFGARVRFSDGTSAGARTAVTCG